MAGLSSLATPTTRTSAAIADRMERSSRVGRRFRDDSDSPTIDCHGVVCDASDHVEPPPVSGLLGRGEPGPVAGQPGRGRGVEAEAGPVRLGVIGIGNRGTALLRGLLELPGAPIVAVCDAEPKHRQRGQGIVEKARGQRPDVARRSADGSSIVPTSTRSSSPFRATCTSRSIATRSAAGKHLYAEKPLGLDARRLRSADRRVGRGPRAGGPRRLPAAVEPAVSRGSRADPPGRAGPADRGARHLDQQQRPDRPATAAGWAAASGRATGWSSRPSTSGTSSTGSRASCRSGPAAGAAATSSPRSDPLRDVTDHYAVELEWADGFRASFVQSWIAPADDGFTGSSLRVLGEEGGFDFATGSLTFRDRSLAPPDDPPRPSGRHPAGPRGVPRRGPAETPAPSPAHPGRRPRRHPHRPAGPQGGR